MKRPCYAKRSRGAAVQGMPHPWTVHFWALSGGRQAQFSSTLRLPYAFSARTEKDACTACHAPPTPCQSQRFLSRARILNCLQAYVHGNADEVEDRTPCEKPDSD